MNNGFSKPIKRGLTTLAMVIAFSCFVACTDDYKLDNPGNNPEWLGNSIYGELKNPGSSVLKGTFNNYLRLIDDLGYAETLGKTGSKTIFPANDEAFTRFFSDNTWGVTKYEDLTPSMKKMLLYSSMLDNAILVELLSNVSASSTSVSTGVALKHTTGVNVIDTITHIYGPAGLPVNNRYWTPFYTRGINLVMDATRPMMVHFTAEQMRANNITTMGVNSDFSVITGSEYNEVTKSAYIFRNRIIGADVTCRNGYIHQMQNVIVPPGNLAEVLRTSGETNYFSRMLDRFSAPFYDAVTTNNYNDYAQANGLSLVDSIFQKRYLSERSEGGGVMRDPYGKVVSRDGLLPYDPGWNTYTSGITGANILADIAAMFVPNDAAMEQYFLPGGSGAFLIDQYGKKSNTRANLSENIDSIPQNIIQAFLSNLMKSSFIGTVPSKFGDVMDDASDPMGLTLGDITTNTDGTYNVKIANNGVAYILNKVYAPNKYVAVSAPALLSDDMKVINWGIQDKTNLRLNFYAYLLAMSANYALFLPTDAAFGRYYVDPAFLKHAQPRALKFYYDKTTPPYLFCSAWKYDPTTGMVGDSIGRANNIGTQFIDILNYHTVVLNSGETPGGNKYYKTKHGGAIAFDGSTVQSGGQLQNSLPASNITKTYNQKNGKAFAIDHLIQAPQNSVYKTLSDDTQFSSFMELCSPENLSDMLSFAGISANKNSFGHSPQDAYSVFVDKNGLDFNVNYFNTYNYTVYAPDNTAMNAAYAAGLPRWSDVYAITSASYTPNSAEFVAAQAKALAMINEINSFIRYHFQDNSVYADNTVENGEYSTASSDSLGLREKLIVKTESGNGKIYVQDNRGKTIIIDATDSKMVNRMTRDYIFNAKAQNAISITTSSFAVVHQISTPLNIHKNSDRYDAAWTGSGAKQWLLAHRRAFLAKQKEMLSK